MVFFWAGAISHGAFLAACNHKQKLITWNPGSYNKSIPNLGSGNSEIQKKSWPKIFAYITRPKKTGRQKKITKKSAKDQFLAPQFWVENKHVFETTKFRILSMEYFQFWW